MFCRIATALALTLAVALPTLAATPVNINKADATTIADALDGIGQSKAEAIVAYRDEHGPFKSAEELTQIKGIGQATLDRNRDAILFADAGGKASDNAPAAATSKPRKGKARQAVATTAE